MKLGQRIFLSHLVSIGIGLLVLTLSMAVIGQATIPNRRPPPLAPAPAVAQPPPQGLPLPAPGQGQGQGPRGPNFRAEVEAAFQEALSNSLLIAGVAALGVATVLSWFISQQISRPLAQVARASQRIAAGHYDERLPPPKAQDEIGDLTHSFNRMAAALDETETLRRQLISDVSHELKTPLASIRGYMEGLQDGVIRADAETFQMVHREASRLQRLVDALQQLSQAEASQLHIEPEPCDVGTLIESTSEWIRPQFQDKNVALVVTTPHPALTVQADFDRIRQVLLNLLGNALAYTPPAGEVKVTARGNGSHVVVQVEDTGIGLEPRDLTAVFQRFYRVDKSRARASGGSGIGLTIARHIIEAHGGTIHAESEGKGRGSRFVFTLPAGR